MSRNASLIGMTDAAHTSGPQVIPPEARVHTAVIVGNSGSGKSSAARAAFVEPILRAGRRCCIIDPTGVWWGLRFMADGAPGLRVAIVGGLYGDAPLSDYDAVSLADWIGESDQPVIVDVSEMTIGERQDFGADFFAQLYKANRRPLHLVIDEADEFAPQNPMPETRRLLHHVDRIVRRGRVRGFRPIMITQRPSVLHKNVMSQASALLAMALLGSQDRDAVQAWIKGQGDIAAGKEVLHTLARLHVGEGWAWVPRLGILNRGRFPMFETFDSSRTPKDDEPPVDPPGAFPWREEFARMLEGVTRAPDEPAAQEPARARPAADRGKPDESEWLAGWSKGREEGVAAGDKARQADLARVAAAADELLAGIRQASDSLVGLAEELVRKVVDSQTAVLVSVHPHGDLKPDTARAIAEMARAGAAQIKAERPALARARGVLALQGAAEKLLHALATLREPRRWPDVCVIAGLSCANGYFYGGRKALIDGGFAEEASGVVQITEPGVVAAGGRRPPLTRGQIVSYWSSKLRAPAGMMLQAIAVSNGLQLGKRALAAAVGLKPDNGYWYGGVKALRDANLVEQDGDAYRLTSIVREAK